MLLTLDKDNQNTKFSLTIKGKIIIDKSMLLYIQYTYICKKLYIHMFFNYPIVNKVDLFFSQKICYSTFLV